MLGVKDIRVAGTGDCGMRRLPPNPGGGRAPALHLLYGHSSWFVDCRYCGWLGFVDLSTRGNDEAGPAGEVRAN